MKRFDFEDDTSVFVGEPEEIKALYKSMETAFNKDKSNFCPMYCNSPKFDPRKMYGLVVDENGFFYIINEHVALSFISSERFTVKG